ncbi:MAG TPA: class I SAM-dependent methyltransferase [Xanthobacteraceae bacterium]|jgi:ubiquinone/menaquinone biosynthesis C-methylase UbiE
MDEIAVRTFWEEHPCGDQQVGGLAQAFAGDYKKFFNDYDTFRYVHEAHILRALDRFSWKGKRVLEIGIGQGAEAEQIISRGACWSGLDLTEESVNRMRARAAVHNLPIADLKVGSALNIPYRDQTFDVVFSHGVLHHVPEIHTAQREIWRVLKPDGVLIMMVYAKHSLNYHVSIRIVRRLGLIALMIVPGMRLGGIYKRHCENAKARGILNYLRMENFVHRSTDGPDNPYSKVYTRAAIQSDFPDFELLESFKLWMHAPPLPAASLPGESVLGWHLWAQLRRRSHAGICSRPASR